MNENYQSEESDYVSDNITDYREAERQYFSELMDKRFRNFKSMNPGMMAYLNTNFDQPDFMYYLHECLLSIVRSNPSFTLENYASFFTNKFWYSHYQKFLKDLGAYLTKSVEERMSFVFTKLPYKNDVEREIYNSLPFLTEFVASIIFNKMLIYDLYKTEIDFMQLSEHHRKSYLFYPLATTNYALGNYYWFHANVV